MTQAQLTIIKDAGYSLCPSCGGSGELSLGQPSAPEQMSTCHKCKGTGLAMKKTKITNSASLPNAFTQFDYSSQEVRMAGIVDEALSRKRSRNGK